MRLQKIRKFLLITSLLLFPITMWYMSPYLIIQAAMEHIMNGSFFIFVLMFLCSTFMGRVFCGYLCPMGGLQECTMLITDKHPKQGWKNKIKYVIWSVWMASIVLCYILGKGPLKTDFIYMTDHGISVSEIYNYIIYYGVILLIFLPAVFAGKRVACHYYCWMAPFMVIGSKVGQLLHIPQIHIKAKKEECISCGICNKNCPMSLNVKEMVQSGQIVNTECINCGACIANCPKHVLSYNMKPIQKAKQSQEKNDGKRKEA